MTDEQIEPGLAHCRGQPTNLRARKMMKLETPVGSADQAVRFSGSPRG